MLLSSSQTPEATYGCSQLNSEEANEGRDCCEAHIGSIRCSIDVVRESVLWRAIDREGKKNKSRGSE